MTGVANENDNDPAEFMNNDRADYTTITKSVALIDFGFLPLGHFLLAVLIVAIWGTNFVVIHQGLEEFPPLTFAALRFFLASVPLLIFFRWPATTVLTVASYGVLIGVGQFGLMLYAMNGHISPGLASVLIQSQAFFTVVLAIAIAGERIGIRNIIGLSCCAVGVGIIAFHIGGDASILGIILVLGAALAWGGANIIARRAGAISAVAMVVWSNAFAVLPLSAAAYFLEGPEQISASLIGASLGAWATVFWQAFANALFGYAAWNWLLGRHPASRIAPLGLMVPVFGLGASALYLGETMPAWKLIAATAIVSGLAINLLKPKDQNAVAVPRKSAGTK